MRPISASQALRGRQLISTNRFEVLRNRDNSSDPTQGNLRKVLSRSRDNSASSNRSESTKRKADSDDSSMSQQPKRPYQGNSLNPNNNGNSTGSGNATLDLLKVTDTLQAICNKVGETLAGAKIDPAVEAVFGYIWEFMTTTTKLQEELVKSLATGNGKHQGNKVYVPAPKIQVVNADSSDNSESEMDTGPFSYSQMASRKPARKAGQQRLATASNSPPMDPKVKNFSEAVKKAERSTLVFNLNMGTQKILNEKTILEKATLALTAAAAIVEGNQPNRPSAGAVEALDDVLSIAKSVTLFGKSTRPFKNKVSGKEKDSRNGSFCTVPVKYEFKDRDSRVAAESVLRAQCKVECSTPYPVILRHCIRQVVDHIRQDYPGEFVRISVDVAKFGLKIARRCNDSWVHYEGLVTLPEEAYNVSARTVPDNINVGNLPPRRVIPQAENTAE